MLSDPRHVTIHPPLQELSARRADAAVRLEEAVLHLDEDLGLAKRRYIKIGEDSAQMLLSNRRADRANRDTSRYGDDCSGKSNRAK